MMAPPTGEAGSAPLAPKLTRNEPRPSMAGRERAVTAATPFGVYVHIPFCRRRCDYCAFATWTDRPHLMADYAAACRAELTSAALGPATSVFFGGGTPSLLPTELLVSILDAISLAPGA